MSASPTRVIDLSFVSTSSTVGAEPHNEFTTNVSPLQQSSRSFGQAHKPGPIELCAGHCRSPGRGDTHATHVTAFAALSQVHVGQDQTAVEDGGGAGAGAGGRCTAEGEGDAESAAPLPHQGYDRSFGWEAQNKIEAARLIVHTRLLYIVTLDVVL